MQRVVDLDLLWSRSRWTLPCECPMSRNGRSGSRRANDRNASSTSAYASAQSVSPPSSAVTVISR
jgi:hypothetical protein